MMGSEETSDNSIYPTSLDEQRILNASPGDSINGESGNFQVLIYKDSYVLLLNDYKKGPAYSEYSNYEKLMKFLKKN